MIYNYFILAWRNLLKRKGFSLINSFGLAAGIAICMLIVLFIRDELRFDRFLPNGERIFRMVVDRKYPGRSTSYSIIPQSYAAVVKQECPEVEEAVRVFNFLGGGSVQYRYEDKKFEEFNVLQTDSTFFKVFNVEFLAGDAVSALNRPNSVVMTESTAIRYFGGTDQVVGKFIQPEGNDNQPLQVTAICMDWPEHSHFDFDLLLTTAGNVFTARENYVGFAAHTYFLLKPNVHSGQVESKMPEIIAKYAAGDIARQFSIPFDQFQAAGNGYRYYLQALTDIHLTSQLEGELKPNGSMTAIYAFGIVALFILLLAMINFVNLSTARSGERAREVGIRKTFGSDKRNLVFQFLGESVLLGLASLVIAIGLIYLVLPFFNRLSGKTFSVSDLFHSYHFALLAGMALITGLLAGIYPAFVLASFRPVRVLKGKLNTSAYGRALRNGLVVFQFSISIILIICTLVVNRQMNFMTGNHLGYNKDHTILIQRTDLLDAQTQAFKQALRQVPGVVNVSGASAFPGDPNYFGVSWREAGDRQPMTGRGIFADDQYQSLFGLELLEGRFFSKEYGTDSLAVVLNESAVKELGLVNPIGARLVTESDFLNGTDNQPYEYHVIGVLKDYNYQNLHLPIVPLVFNSTSRFRDVAFTTAVKMQGQGIPSSLRAIEERWNQFVKDRPFHFEFMDKTIARQYEAETRTRSIFTFFSVLAICIACIGLLGLAAYTTQQRMKEISMRKILGASTLGIVTLLSRDFLKLISISVLVAFPLAWYGMTQWLQGFSYRVDPSWWIFALAAVGTLFIALFTLGAQAYRAGRANVIKTLRTE